MEKKKYNKNWTTKMGFILQLFFNYEKKNRGKMHIYDVYMEKFKNRKKY